MTRPPPPRTIIPMLGIHDFWLFAASGIVLTITPGPDTLYILGRSIAQGRRAGMLSVLGISTGILIHTAAAALGLSALLASSAAAFTVVRWVGAAYLVYLGLRMLLRPGASDQNPAASMPPMSPIGIYRQGLFTNLLNPKVALFFLAFLPQFVDPRSPHRIAAFLLLGLEFVLIGTTWSLGLAWFAATVSRRLREQRTPSRWLGRASGVLFISLGARVARG